MYKVAVQGQVQGRWSLGKYKVRLVANGFTPKEGIYHEKKFAPTIRIGTIGIKFVPRHGVEMFEPSWCFGSINTERVKTKIHHIKSELHIDK